MRSAAALLLFLAGCVSAGSWIVPGVRDTSVDFVGIGNHPRTVVVRGGRTVYRGPDMQDTEFFEPKFFSDGGRVSMLADYGSEDSWGIVALSFEGDRVRDLGFIDVATPADELLGWTGSAVSHATVRHENGMWVVTFDGPLVENPGGEDEVPIAGKGDATVYRESGGKFVRTALNTPSTTRAMRP